MRDINAKDRGRAAFFNNKTKQPLNDIRFVELMYSSVEEAVEESELTHREGLAAHMTEWKTGWDEAKAETEAPPKLTKKKAKKKTKRKAKK